MSRWFSCFGSAVGLPDVVAFGKTFQEALYEIHALAKLELLPVGHGYFPAVPVARSAMNPEESPM
jgi:hypothetical protein